MKRYLRFALPIAATVMLLACAAPRMGAATSRDCTNPGPRCEAMIIVDPMDCNKSTVDPDEIHFPRQVHGNPNRKILVVWTLPRDSGYGFCPQPIVRDGVFLKDYDPDDQFDPKGFGSGTGPGQCNRKSAMLEAKNTQPGVRYPYGIQFHSTDGKKTCTIDPVMFND